MCKLKFTTCPRQIGSNNFYCLTMSKVDEKEYETQKCALCFRVSKSKAELLFVAGEVSDEGEELQMLAVSILVQALSINKVKQLHYEEHLSGYYDQFIEFGFEDATRAERMS